MCVGGGGGGGAYKPGGVSEGLGGLITGGIFFLTGRWTFNWSGAYKWGAYR